MGLQQSLQKQKFCEKKYEKKQKDKMETSGIVYEVDCNNCFKRYTGETGRKWKKEWKNIRVM